MGTFSVPFVLFRLSVSTNLGFVTCVLSFVCQVFIFVPDIVRM
jgi:hypothetical protein